MKKLVLGLIVLGSATLHAAIAVVQPTAGLPVAATQCAGTPTSCGYTMPSQPAAGNALIASASFVSTAATSSVTDTGVNTYASTTAAHVGGGACSGAGSCVQVWYATNIATAGSFVVTTHSAVGGSQTAFAAEYSGVQTATPVDKQTQLNGTSTTPAVTSQTATNANSLYVATVVHDGGGTVTIAGGAGFTERGENENTANEVIGEEDAISSAALTGPFTLGSSNAWAETMVIFIPATGAATAPTRTLLGVGKAAH